MLSHGRRTAKERRLRRLSLRCGEDWNALPVAKIGTIEENGSVELDTPKVRMNDFKRSFLFYFIRCRHGQTNISPSICDDS